MISLGPISGQKYLQQGYNFTAGAGGAALPDLLLLCIKLSERSAHTNVLASPQDPPTPDSHRRFLLVESRRAHSLLSKGCCCVNLSGQESLITQLWLGMNSNNNNNDNKIN